MLSHKNLLSNLELIHRAFEMEPESSSVFWLPPYHDMGLIGGILEPLYAGSPTVLMAPVAFLQCPFRWLDAMSRTRAVISGAPNFAYDLCVQKTTPEQRSRLDLSSWRLAFNGAEPIRHETQERFAQTFADCGFRPEAFYPCYGLAEATLFVSGGLKAALPIVRTVGAKALENNQLKLAAHDDTARTLVGSGQCPPAQQLRIVHPETCIPCAAGEVGEIWVRGASVAAGYWNRPEESAPVFGARLAGSKEGPFLRTGDLGFLLDGELFVTGRAKDLIILHGKNHYPQDIEKTVEENCPEIRPSCLAAFAFEADGEERLGIVAEIERSARKQSLDDTLAAIRRAVAVHHDVAVCSIALIKPLTIPKTSSGKIQRHVCRERFLDKSFDILAEWTQDLEPVRSECEIQDSEAVIPAPVTDKAEAIQAWLVTQIAERLKMPAREVDVHLPFASLGMDSMTAVLLAGDLEVWLERRLPPTLMYDHPSIDALARHLAEEPAEPEPTPEPVAVQSIDRNGAQDLLARLDDLSSDETAALLNEMLAEEAFRSGK
jgi:acyl-CoA synthetase (AMP-forming)/AMP-acid ligase II/acyl carrier protein